VFEKKRVLAQDNLDHGSEGFAPRSTQVASSEQASAMQTDEERSGKKLNFTESSTCEAELYGYLLVLMYAIDKKQFKLVSSSSRSHSSIWLGVGLQHMPASAIDPCHAG
jgi:hypothetical protein